MVIAQQQGAHDRGPIFLPEPRVHKLRGRNADMNCAINSGDRASGNKLWGKGSYLPRQFRDGAGLYALQLRARQLQQHGCAARCRKIDVQLEDEIHWFMVLLPSRADQDQPYRHPPRADVADARRLRDQATR